MCSQSSTKGFPLPGPVVFLTILASILEQHPQASYVTPTQVDPIYHVIPRRPQPLLSDANLHLQHGVGVAGPPVRQSGGPHLLDTPWAPSLSACLLYLFLSLTAGDPRGLVWASSVRSGEQDQICSAASFSHSQPCDLQPGLALI